MATAEKMIDEPEFTTIVSFHCQQAVEKYLKAFLLNTGWKLEKIHDLAKLYGYVKQIHDFHFDEKTLAWLNQVYISSHYIGEDGLLPNGEPSSREAREFLDFAKIVEEAIVSELKNTDTDTGTDNILL
jgi:HEPN domain-containing protein